MNKFKYYFILVITIVSFFSCSKDNTTTPSTPPRDHSSQYDTENTLIEDYLRANYIEVINHPGMPDDQNVIVKKITDPATQHSIMSYKDSINSYPRLLVREVSKDLPIHGVRYKIYYLVLRPGVGQSPCNVDGVKAAYHGEYLKRDDTTSEITSTFFGELINPDNFMGLYTSIAGWGEIFPQFKTGTFTSNPDGTTSYNNFGAGVMFIPSGLAYYNMGAGIIPGYVPLVYSFKLYAIDRSDLDLDGIPSYLEDLNGDSYLYDYRNTAYYSSSTTINKNDTDGDTTPDFLDDDDDGDSYITKNEIKRANGTTYLFEEIPNCSGAVGPAVVKRYLDKNCHKDN